MWLPTACNKCCTNQLQSRCGYENFTATELNFNRSYDKHFLKRFELFLVSTARTSHLWLWLFQAIPDYIGNKTASK